MSTIVEQIDEMIDQKKFVEIKTSMNNVKLFAKKFENEIDVNALKIDIKISIIEIKSFVKEFRDDVTNENEMSKNFREMTTTNFRSTNIAITNEFAKNVASN